MNRDRLTGKGTTSSRANTVGKYELLLAAEACVSYAEILGFLKKEAANVAKQLRSIGCHLLNFPLRFGIRERRHLRFSLFRKPALSPQSRFQGHQLRLDVLRGFALPDDFFAIAPQEIVNCLNANLDRASGLVF